MRPSPASWRRLLRPQRASLAPRAPPSSPLRAASGGDLRSDLTAPARGAADRPRSGRRNDLRSNKETASPSIRSPLTDGLIQGRGFLWISPVEYTAPRPEERPEAASRRMVASAPL